MSMVVLDRDGARFNYRVVGVCIHDDHVLLHRAGSDDFWALPGGRCEMLESSPETMRREMREEIDLDIELGRLLWIVENFFSYGDMRFHELALYHEIILPAGCLLLGKDFVHRSNEITAVGAEIPLEFRWFPLGDLPETRLYPAFLRTALQSPPDTPRHVIHVDPDE